jgi:transposase-like protein
MPAAGARAKRGRPRSATPRAARYKPSGGDSPVILCQACGECPPIKSNRGIKEELDRMTVPLDASALPVCCRTATCANHINIVPVAPAGYRRFGKSEIGSPRWQCRICGKTVSSPQKAIHQQQASHKNVSIFMDLVSKVPLKRIARTKRVSMNTVYNKIDFIYNQCVAFAAQRERGAAASQEAYRLTVRSTG